MLLVVGLVCGGARLIFGKRRYEAWIDESLKTSGPETLGAIRDGLTRHGININ